MELNKQYKHYTKAQISEIRKFAKDRIKILNAYLRRVAPKEILELGCGEGSLALEIKRNLGEVEIFGLDLSEEGVKLANKKGIITKVTDLNNGIPFKSNKFDLVFSNQVVEHIYDTDLLFRESFRVLKKGGYLITITPNLSFWINRLIFSLGIYPIFLEVSLKNKLLGEGFLKKIIYDKDTVGHVRVFNLPALVDILELYGFKVEEKIGLPFPFKTPRILTLLYLFLDWIFSKKPSLARDIMVIARK